MHGGASPGAPKDKANGNYRHGGFTRKTLEERRQISQLIRMLREDVEKVE
jgi:hypothetical protein